MHQVDTTFLRRLRARDERAWYELWEAFGPVVRAMLARGGNGRLGEETLRDLTQDTLAAHSNSIDRFDPARGVRFSTWLLAIAKHVLGDEYDRRFAQKRGGGMTMIQNPKYGPWQATYQFKSPGTYWFACPASNHCEQGMKMKVS